MGFFDSVFSDPAGGGIPGNQTHAAVSEWVRRFVTIGGPKIAARLFAQDRCEHPTCQTRAVAAARCLTCRRMVCFDHAAFVYTGDAICFGCAHIQPVGETPPPPPPPPPPQASAQDAALYAAAVASLGLTPTVTRIELQKRVKELRLKHHPDRAKPEEAEASARKFVTEANGSMRTGKMPFWASTAGVSVGTN